MATILKELHIKNLKDYLTGQFGEDVKFKANWSGETLTALKLNVKSLNSNQIKMVNVFAQGRLMDVEITRSGTGLKIQFTKNNN